MTITLALTNATGRQAASLARTASAVGYNVIAHIVSPKYSPLVAKELEELEGVTVVQGRLADANLRTRLFADADIAFINTTTFDDELVDGKACLDTAKAAGVEHVVYSSMPDHSVVNKDWQALPHWAPKWHVEQYARTLDLPVTYVYTGIYHNNFTSLPYPLFCLKEVPWDEVQEWEGDWERYWVPQKDDKKTKGRRCGFEWQAPFPPDLKLPWLDCEHDFGPAVLQVFKQGPEKWAGRR
jgi:NmrA-like family